MKNPDSPKKRWDSIVSKLLLLQSIACILFFSTLVNAAIVNTQGEVIPTDKIDGNILSLKPVARHLDPYALHMETLGLPDGDALLTLHTSEETEFRYDDGFGCDAHELPLTGESYSHVFKQPFAEDFTTTPFPPAEWTCWSGILQDDPTLTPVTGFWTHHVFGNQTPGTNNAAHINIYSERNHWLVSPKINLGDTKDEVLAAQFEIALTPWVGTDPIALGPDDYVAFLISTDGGQTWSPDGVLIDWDIDDSISPTGDMYSIPLDGYSGIVKFAFYVERPSGGTPDLRFYVNNLDINPADIVEAFEVTFDVMDPDGNAIANAIVTFNGVTYNAGHYVIENVAPGTYNYMIEKEGYHSAEGQVTVDADVAIKVSLTPDELETFEVTFHVDITKAIENDLLEGFDPDIHHILMTGSMLGWAEPETDPENQVMDLLSANPMVYGITHYLETGTYDYKYFSDLIGYGWDGGEWEGTPNRELTVTGPMEVFDVWGEIEPVDPDPEPIITLPYFEDFTGTEQGDMPEYWQATHINWSVWNSNNAGGESVPELRFNWDPSATGVFRAITPLIDATGLDAVDLTFMHSLNDFSGDYTLKVQTSIDGETWTTQWSQYIAANKDIPANREASIIRDIPPTEMAISLDGIGGEDFHLAFVFDGNSFNINRWYIDDIDIRVPIPFTYAGANADICAGDDYWLYEASASHSFLSTHSILWTTTGDGYFITPSCLNPKYVPGHDDIDSETVELCLTASYDFFGDMTDCLTLTIGLASDECCCPDFVLKDAVEICPPENACNYDLRAPVFVDSRGPQTPDMTACKTTVHTYTVYPNNPELYTYTWTITGGTPSNITGNPVSVLWGSGSTGFIEVVISGEHCEGHIIQEVCLIDGPKADFEIDEVVICINSPVIFRNTSIGGETYFWDFGNGQTSANRTPPPQHYDEPGVYVVSLKVADLYTGNATDTFSCGCIDVVTKTITVMAETGPIIELDCCFGTVCAGGISSFKTDHDCLVYDWTVTGGIIISGEETNQIEVLWEDTYPGVPTTVSLEVPGCITAPCPGKATINVPVIYDAYPITGKTSLCIGSSATYSLPVWPGTNYTWDVQPSAGVQFNKSDRNVPNANITFTEPGIYTIECHYYNPLINCVGTSSITVEVLPVFRITRGYDEVCEGSNHNYDANYNANWSVPPTAGAVVNPVSGWITNITWNNPGVYTIYANPTVPSLFCNTEALKVVNVVAKPVLDPIEGPSIVCPDKNQTYSIASNVSRSRFNWATTDETGVIETYMGTYHDSLIVRWTESGPWQLSVNQLIELSNGTFCSSDFEVIDVQIYDPPGIISGTNTVCMDDIVEYNASGPLPPGGIQWSVDPPGKGTFISGQGTNNVSIQWHGSVSTTATLSATHCGGSASLTITVNEPPEAKATYNITYPTGVSFPVFCHDGEFSITLQSVHTCIGCTYQWYQDGAIIPSATGESLILDDSYFTVPGKYEYYVKITRNECTGRSNNIIVVIKNCYFISDGGECPNPCPLDDCEDAFAWFGTYPTCDGFELIDKSHPVPGPTYIWTVTGPGSGSFSPSNSEPNPTLTVTESGIYTITLSITSSTHSECNVTWSKAVSIFFLEAGFTFTTPVCIDEPVSFSATPNNPAYNYLWDFGDGKTSNSPEPQHAYSSTGTYNAQVTITDTYDCPDTHIESITVPPSVPCSIDASDNFFCPGQYVTLSACTDMVHYQWYKDGEAISGANGIEYLVYQHGEYFVETINHDGCRSVSNSIYIYMHPEPLAEITGETYVCSGTWFNLSTPYFTNYSYDWTEVSGTATASFEPNNSSADVQVYVPSGVTGEFIFSVLVTDTITGCTASDYICVTINQVPELSVIPDLDVCEGTPVTFTPDPNNPDLYDYQWSSGQATPVITAVAAGDYWLTITNKITGCSTTTFAATIKPKPDLSLFTLGCDTILCNDTLVLSLPLPLFHDYWSDHGFPTTFIGTYTPVMWFDQFGVHLGTGETLEFSSSDDGYFDISVVVENYLGCISEKGVFCVDVICSQDECETICEDPSFSWAEQIGDDLINYGKSIATDEAGYVYTTGAFSGIAKFGDFLLEAEGCLDVFVAKQNGAGGFIWVTQLGGELMDEGRGIAVTPDGSNVYITGFITEIAASGDIEDKAFVARLDGGDGSIITEPVIITDNPGAGNDIALDAAGNVYVTGYECHLFYKTQPEKPTIPSSCSLANIFVRKMDAILDEIWHIEFEGDGIDSGNGIAVDIHGNVLITGTIENKADFAAAGILYPDVGNDIFIAKLHNDGTVQWAHRMGGPEHDFGAGVAVDESGNAFITGSFKSGPVTGFGPTSLIAGGSSDIFVSKWSPAGAHVWTSVMAGTDDPDAWGRGWSIDLGPCHFTIFEHVFITGMFNGDIDFDPGHLDNIPGSTGYDMFILKLRAFDGKYASLYINEGTSWSPNSDNAVAVDKHGCIYTTGGFVKAYFDPGSSLPMTSYGERDVFIQKFCCCCIDEDAFINKVEQGWHVVANHDLCFVIVSADQFSECHEFTTHEPIWGDGSDAPTPGNIPAQGTWGYIYDHSGVYNICIEVQEIDETGVGCFTKTMCTTVTMNCLGGSVIIPVDTAICYSDSVAYVALSSVVYNPDCSIEQLRWYIESSETPGWPNQPYQITQEITDLQLQPNMYPGIPTLKVKAELDIICDVGGIETITSNEGIIYLCRPVQITINNPNPIPPDGHSAPFTPQPITAIINLPEPDVPDCDYTSIQWIYNGNIVSTAATYQPPELIFEGEPGDLFTDHVFTVLVTNNCGIQSAQVFIRVYDPDVCDLYPEHLVIKNEILDTDYHYHALQTIELENIEATSAADIYFTACQSVTMKPGITFAPATDGKVHIIVYDPVDSHSFFNTFLHCCDGWSKVISIIEETDIMEHVVTDFPDHYRENLLFRVYPNPTADTFTLEFIEGAEPEDDAKLFIEILNLVGNKVYSAELPVQSEYIISLEGQQPGMYIIRVVKNNRMGTERIIKR